MNSPKLIGSPSKRLSKDEMNGIERLHIQLRYSFMVEQFCWEKNQEINNGRERF